MLHELKILPEYYDPVVLNHKTFEIRKNDRNYQVGDVLLLREWKSGKYTGREVKRFVSYIYHGNGDFGLADGYCVLGLKRSKPMESIDGGF